MLTILLGILSMCLLGAFGGFIFLHWQKIKVLKDLCDLRQNSTDFYRIESATHAGVHVKIKKEVDLMLAGVRVFLERFNHIQQENEDLRAKYITEAKSAEITNLRLVNEDLTFEFAKVLQCNHEYEEDDHNLRQELEQYQIEKFELRQENIRLSTLNRKIQERNNELEYAINLESISMLEKYQEQDKLFGAINDVRRSLTRILNPA